MNTKPIPSAKLQVLHVTYDMEIGGTEQVIRQLLQGLDQSRYQSSVVCINGIIGAMGKDLQLSGVPFYTLSRKPGFDLSLISDLRKLIKKNNIDILHCHQYTPYSYGVLAALMTGIRVIYTEHGRFYPDKYSWKRRLINPLLYVATDSIVAISEATKNALVEYEWIPRKSIGVIYNGFEGQPASVNTAQLKNELGITAQETILGTVSRLDSIKNQSMMIEAFRLVLQSKVNVRLLMVGDGPERAALEKLVEEHNLQNHIVFTGFKGEPGPFFDLIDIFLLSSHSEGTSMTLLEAISKGKPCVATSVGGNVEILEHDKSGLLVETNNHLLFADAILNLLNDRNTYDRISKHAHQRYLDKFDLGYMIENYQTLYDGRSVQAD